MTENEVGPLPSDTKSPTRKQEEKQLALTVPKLGTPLGRHEGSSQQVDGEAKWWKLGSCGGFGLAGS